MSYFAMRSNFVFFLGRVYLYTNAIDRISHSCIFVCDAFYHCSTVCCLMHTVCTKDQTTFCVGMNELKFKAFVSTQVHNPIIKIRWFSYKKNSYFLV